MRTARRRTIAALSASTPVAERGGATPPTGHVARNTAIFSIATGFSRIAGLAREVIAARFFGTGSWYSAFTIAFQVPNLVSNLFANAALSAAFVPVFTELLQEGRKKEAFRLGFQIDWHDPRVRQVFALMLPVTIGLGIVNLDQLINSVFGTFVSKDAPSAINYAFRIYMLPQGMFSVAVAISSCTTVATRMATA